MIEVTKNLNGYVDNRRVLEPNLQIWDYKHMSALFYIQPYYHQLYLIFYMGVVSLPFKTDFCKYNNT